MSDELRALLRADEWQGIAVIFEFIIVIGGSLWAAVKYKLIAGIKEYRLIIGLVLLYFVVGYLIIHSKQALWIFWWFILIIFVYVINQLLSYPELFIKGFQDDFRNGLEIQNWEYYGDWLVMKESDGNVLQVSNSDAGGISTKCKAWTNYRFSFDTKIIRHNSSWIIRATDVFSYIMLQCKTDELRVHYRLQGNWFVVEVSKFPFNIALRERFHVEIEVKDVKVKAKITYQTEVYTVLDSTILQPRVLPIIPVYEGGNNVIAKLHWACSYPHGSVGFRQFGDEAAFFKNVKVFKI